MKIGPQLRLRKRALTSELVSVDQPLVSIEHGYLWIGGEQGPALVTISGRKTLLKIGAMIRRYAR